jgi:outer membrane protein TolC
MILPAVSKVVRGRAIRRFSGAAFLASLVHAALVPMVHSMTLDEAVERALANNPRTAPARAAARAAELGPGALSVLPPPEIEGEAVPLSFGADYEAELGVNQKLPLWGRARAARALARAELERLRWASRTVEWTVAAGARERYRRVVLLTEQLAVVREQERRENSIVRQAEARFPHGEVSEIDLRQFQARAASSRARARSTELELAAARLDLSLWTGLPDTTGLRVERIPPSPLESIVLDTLLASRPDLRGLEASWRAAEAEVAVARADRYEDPKVGLFMRWKEASEPPHDTESFLGGRFSFPLPLPGYGSGQVALARARAEAARLGYETARQTAAEELRVALARAEGARIIASQLSSGGAIDSVRSAVRLAEEAYRGGRIGAFEVIEVSRAAVELERDALEALDRWYEAVGLVEERVGVTLVHSVPR